MKTITGPRTGIEQDKELINWFVMFSVLCPICSL